MRSARCRRAAAHVFRRFSLTSQKSHRALFSTRRHCRGCRGRQPPQPLGTIRLSASQREEHKGVGSAEEAINTQYLPRSRSLVTAFGAKSILRKVERTRHGFVKSLSGWNLASGATTESARGRYGLGSNNLLYMACELLLLGREPDGLPLLLIEEPEAHLHPQRQLRLMEFLTLAASGKVKDTKRSVQVILSTHSPNLASKIPLPNMILLQGGRAFSLAGDRTRLKQVTTAFLSGSWT